MLSKQGTQFTYTLDSELAQMLRLQKCKQLWASEDVLIPLSHYLQILK